MDNIDKHLNEFKKELKIINVEYLQGYLNSLKKYELNSTNKLSSYNSGYYDGFQKAIELLNK